MSPFSNWKVTFFSEVAEKVPVKGSIHLLSSGIIVEDETIVFMVVNVDSLHCCTWDCRHREKGTRTSDT